MTIKKIISIGILILVSSGYIYAQSSKIIDSFSSTSNYYSSVVQGTGNIQLSTSTNTSVDGSALKVDYTFSSSNNSDFVEILRNYGTSTLDLSFLPDKLEIQVYGQSQNTDAFSFMFYEDNDRDGQLDADDDIWVYRQNNAFSTTGWQTISIIYSSCTKLLGNGNSLNLNRIRAWRLVIHNSQSKPHSGAIYFDNLLQKTQYITPTSGNTKLNGSFIQLWNDVGCACGQWTEQQWVNEFMKMKSACLNHIIVQYGHYQNNAWYTPSTASFTTYQNPTINRIISAAEKTGMKITLGIYFDESWNSSDKSSASTYSTLLTKQKKVIDELWNLFGSSSAFNGWYIPQEINDLEWQTPTNKSLLAQYLRDVSDYAAQASNSKPVYIAPFFGPNVPADVLKDWYISVLSTAPNITHVFPQDGVGTTTKIVDVDVPHYFNAIKEACSSRGVIFGSTVESFQQIHGWPIDQQPFQATSTTFNNLKKQLWVAGQFANEIVQFEWPYMANSNNLFQEYKNYSSCSITQVLDVPVVPGGIYPNPVEDVLRIQDDQIVEAIISNSLGQQLMIQKSTSMIPVTTLESGIYQITITTSTYIRTSTFVKK